MNLDIQEALKTLEIFSNPVTHENIKSNYRKLASKYHPDRNPNGLKLMQTINMNYDFLSNLPECSLFIKEDKKYEKNKPYEYSLFRSLGMNVKEEKLKVWVSGKTFSHKEKLKEYNFRWSPDKKSWWRYID